MILCRMTLAVWHILTRNTPVALTLVRREDALQSVQSVGEAAYILCETLNVVVTEQRVAAVVADATQGVTLGHPESRHHGGIQTET